MKHISIVLFLFTLAACNTRVSEGKQENRNPAMLKNFSGTWVADYDSIQYRESWTEMSDSLFVSTGVMLEGNDTAFSEKVDIAIRADGVYYIPTVADQNQGKPVSFKMKELTDTTFIAENLQHDFPQRIVYALKGDSLIAYIEGNTPKEKNHREYFRMKRMK